MSSSSKRLKQLLFQSDHPLDGQRPSANDRVPPFSLALILRLAYLSSAVAAFRKVRRSRPDRASSWGHVAGVKGITFPSPVRLLLSLVNFPLAEHRIASHHSAEQGRIAPFAGCRSGELKPAVFQLPPRCHGRNDSCRSMPRRNLQQIIGESCRGRLSISRKRLTCVPLVHCNCSQQTGRTLHKDLRSLKNFLLVPETAGTGDDLPKANRQTPESASRPHATSAESIRRSLPMPPPSPPTCAARIPALSATTFIFSPRNSISSSISAMLSTDSATGPTAATAFAAIFSLPAAEGKYHQ